MGDNLQVSDGEIFFFFVQYCSVAVQLTIVLLAIIIPNMESLLLRCNKPFHFCSKDTHITFLLINF